MRTVGHLCAAGLVAAAVMLLTAASAGQPASAQRPPNIVFVLADDLGVNDLGVYGRKEHRTPNLDRLAAEGLRFTTAYVASPICSPSRAAIMTGRFPARLHLTTFIPGRRDAASQKLLHPPMRQQLPLEEATLAERLRAAGYATAMIGKWHLGGDGFSPREQGFDVFHAGQATTKPSADEAGKGEYDLTREAERFIDANRDRPFFLYLAHNNPHIPFGSARPDLIEANRARSIRRTRRQYRPSTTAWGGCSRISIRPDFGIERSSSSPATTAACTFPKVRTRVSRTTRRFAQARVTSSKGDCACR